MAEQTVILAQPRSRAGKGAARAVRNLGRIPAVIYGGKEEPQLISIETKQITKQLNTGTLMSRVYVVDVEGQQTRVIPRDVQMHPVKDTPIHVDFLRLAPGAKVALMIPVHFINQETCPGLKRGGVLNVVRHEIELLVNADNIPPFLEVDLDGLDIHDSVHISHVKLPSDARPTITDRDFTIVSVAVPAGFVDTAAGAEAEGETEEAKAE